MLIVGEDPLQQFIAKDTTALQSLLEGKPEDVVLNPDSARDRQAFRARPSSGRFGWCCIRGPGMVWGRRGPVAGVGDWATLDNTRGRALLEGPMGRRRLPSASDFHGG